MNENSTPKRLSALVAHAGRLPKRAVVAAVWPVDDSSVDALRRALDDNIVDALLIGDENDIVKNAFSDHIAAGRATLIPADTPADAAARAVAEAREGRADMLMKGLVNTDVLLRAVLNKETGILPAGNILTHIAIADIPAYDRLLAFTDAAVLPAPSLEQRHAQLRYIVDLCRSLGNNTPRVALIHCSEKTDTRHFPVTGDYSTLKERAAGGLYGECVVDGPLDVKVACNLHAAIVKHIDTPLQGQTDALLFPDIESGNVFYKTITLFAGATTAGLLCGAQCPVIVPSRGDSPDTKYYSLAIAALGMRRQ